MGYKNVLLSSSQARKGFAMTNYSICLTVDSQLKHIGQIVFFYIPGGAGIQPTVSWLKFKNFKVPLENGNSGTHPNCWKLFSPNLGSDTLMHTHLKGICTICFSECCYGLIVSIRMESTQAPTCCLEVWWKKNKTVTTTSTKIWYPPEAHGRWTAMINKLPPEVRHLQQGSKPWVFVPKS